MVPHNCGWALRFARLRTYVRPEVLCAQLLLHTMMNFVHTHTQWPTWHEDDCKDWILWCCKFFLMYFCYSCNLFMSVWSMFPFYTSQNYLFLYHCSCLFCTKGEHSLDIYWVVLHCTKIASPFKCSFKSCSFGLLWHINILPPLFLLKLFPQNMKRLCFSYW